MAAVYNDIDNLINDVIANRVGVASLSNDLLTELLARTVEIIAANERPESKKNIDDFQQLLEKISVVLERRIENDSDDDVSKELFDSLERGNFCPAEGNFTLH